MSPQIVTQYKSSELSVAEISFLLSLLLLGFFFVVVVVVFEDEENHLSK